VGGARERQAFRAGAPESAATPNASPAAVHGAIPRIALPLRILVLLLVTPFATVIVILAWLAFLR
jgi:hypothetical protein